MFRNNSHNGGFVGGSSIHGDDVGTLLHLLSSLDSESIPYVSWKNNHQLTGALGGESDLDMFVPLECRSAFLRCAERRHWVRVENPVARYPWVTHIYSLDASLNPYHVHVYFKIVTGESWIKEYILPFDNFMIEERTRTSDGRVWVLNNKAQAYLLAVRHLLKAGSLTSRLQYFREMDSYRQEWHDCDQNVESLFDYGPIHLNGYLARSGLQDGGFDLPTISNAMKLRFSMMPLLWLAWWSLPARRFGSFMARATNKLILKKKKIFPDGGLVIAISGVDGAGKTSMLAEADRILSDFLTVRRYMLGRPQGGIIEILRRLVRNRRASTSAVHHGDATKNLRPLTVISSMSAAVLGLLRLRMARKALRSAMKGELALVDRWPTDIVGMMDGPRIGIDATRPLLIRTCARIEHWSYQRMPRADICFFLEVPVQRLIERNRLRVKADKESDAEIIDRYETNRQYSPLARKVVHFDNDGPFDQKRTDLLSLIWAELANS